MQTQWLMGLAGGLMIGGAAALFLLLNGRVMGASGLLGGLVDGSARNDRGERIAFITALIAVPAMMTVLGLGMAGTSVAPLWVMVVAGFLVGLGTRLANGCTSGHGVCGISRLSVRGIVATCVYLIFGGLAVVISRASGLGV